MKTNPNSHEFQRQMAELFNKALTEPSGLQALAAAIAPPIEQEIKRREITSLLLTEDNLPTGEAAKYQKKPKVKAYYLSPNGSVAQSELDSDEVEFSIRRIASNPMVDISTLKHGNVGRIGDIQKSAADEIRKQIDGKTLTVISAAVPVGNTITCSGGKLTKTALEQAMAVIEDLELKVKYIVARGKRISEIKAFGYDPQTERELQQKGILGYFNGAGIINSSSVALDTVILIPDEEIGKYPVRMKLTAEPYAEQLKFKTGWVVWMEIGQGVTRPDLLSKVAITA